MSKSAETSQDPAKQVNPLKPALEQLNPPNFAEQHQSSSSLMEASCESEILELELNSKLDNSRLEIDASSADISVGLVSVSDDQSKCEESKVDSTVVEGEQDSSIKFDVKNLAEEEANPISALAQGNTICHGLLIIYANPSNFKVSQSGCFSLQVQEGLKYNWDPNIEHSKSIVVSIGTFSLYFGHFSLFPFQYRQTQCFEKYCLVLSKFTDVF